MPHINLLPWREQQLSSYYGSLRDGQNIKNNYLSAEIGQLDKRISEIRELDKKKENLQQRMRLIEELQSSRNLGTQIMDEVAKIVPTGVYLTKLERRGSAIHVVGRSESNNYLSNMLRQVQNSYLLEKPIMQGIIAGEKSSRLLSDFNMEFYVKPFDKIGEVK